MMFNGLSRSDMKDQLPSTLGTNIDITFDMLPSSQSHSVVQEEGLDPPAQYRCE